MRIGDVAAAAGVSTKTLRFYEDIGLLPAPARLSNGYRDYTPETLTRLEFITRGRAAGLSLASLREVLAIRDAGHAPCLHVRETLGRHLAEIDDQLTALATLRATVAEAYDTAANGQPTDCDPDQICSYL